MSKVDLSALAQRVLASAEGALALVPPGERPDAERIVEIFRKHLQRQNKGGTDDTWEGSVEQGARVEVARLAEVLARRSASAMPYAALARGLFAWFSGELQHTKHLFEEFELKLSMRGV